jgi:hypothetical protein
VCGVRLLVLNREHALDDRSVVLGPETIALHEVNALEPPSTIPPCCARSDASPRAAISTIGRLVESAVDERLTRAASKLER